MIAKAEPINEAGDRYPLHHRSEVDVDGDAHRLFALLDDHRRLASHMGKPSLMMAGATMRVEADALEGQAVGVGMALLATAQTRLFVFAFVALLPLGMAFIPPDLSALVSRRGGEAQAGASLGVQNAAGSLGQAAGPLSGGALFIWQVNAPYVFLAESCCWCSRCL